MNRVLTEETHEDCELGAGMHPIAKTKWMWNEEAEIRFVEEEDMGLPHRTKRATFRVLASQDLRGRYMPSTLYMPVLLSAW